MLQSRKSRVIFVTPTTSYEINLTKDQILAGMEIEEHIVADVVCVIIIKRTSLYATLTPRTFPPPFA